MTYVSSQIKHLTLRRHDLFRQAAYVGGAWINSPERMAVTNPANGDVLGHVPKLGAPHVTQAIESAHAAHKRWKAVTATARSTALGRWFQLILDNAEDLARIMTAEQGKPLAESRTEITYAASFVRWFAEEARRVYGETIPSEHPETRLTVLRQPVGVVAAITPWNFPSAMITRKVAPALAVGCTVVLKPSELTPFSALALAALAEEAGLPAGAFNVLTGEPAEIGDVLTTHPLVRKFTFTGSTAVGKMLAARCMSTVKRVSLELGGNAPFIVFDDADIDRAVDGALVSKFRNAGQTCVCPNRFIVQDAVYAEFTEKLAKRAGAITVGDGFHEESQQGPLINMSAVEKVQRHIDDATTRGAVVLTGGKAIPGNGFFYEPTVLINVPRQAVMCREETFGPVAGIIRFTDEREAIAIANDTSSGLAAYVYTRDLERSIRLQEELDYGMVGLNTGIISTAVGPFGGIKESGLGREGSRHGVDDYLDMKMVCTRLSGES